MTLSALDENGNPVDWWFAYKIPKLTQDASTPSATGYEYVYYDPKIGKVDKSPYLLTEGKGAVDLTLSSVFDNPADTTGWIIYNDEMPASVGGKDDGSLGHTKGVIAFDTASQTAFWMLHSWPKYANPGVDGMPTPMYGQTFLCISLDMATAGKIAEQMSNHQEPQVYKPRIPSSLDQSDALYLLTQKLNPNASGDSEVLECTFSRRTQLQSDRKESQVGQRFLERPGRPDARLGHRCGNLDTRKNPADSRQRRHPQNLRRQIHRPEPTRRALGMARNP